ncbi:MAG: glycosyltransferase family protein [Azoarcus sp.]|jgi:hypothetical protein|nr:glycosyltransferase family protein [Azoarcus sp.]
MDKPFFSVIVCSIDPWRFAQISTCYEHLLVNFPFEIIGIHDARSLAESYSRALRRARGDIMIFSHDDILILDPDFGHKIASRLQKFDILGFAGTTRLETGIWWSARMPYLFGAVATPHPEKLHLNIWNTGYWPVADGIQAIDGLCIIARREAAMETGFDETTFDGFHLYDIDFSFSAWRAGKILGVCCDIPIIHASMGKYDKTHEKYNRLFIEKHRDALPASPKPISAIEGIAVDLSDHHVLREVWQEDIFRRVSVSTRRQAAASAMAA